MKCSLCGFKGVKGKEVLECSYCKLGFCDNNTSRSCVLKHLGVCKMDPNPLPKIMRKGMKNEQKKERNRE